MTPYWNYRKTWAVNWLPEHPALGLLEVSSIAAGIKAVDEILKKAPIHLLQTGPVSGGKYLILFSGSEEPVNQSYQHGIDILGDWLIDHLNIPNIHHQVIPTMQGVKQVVEWDAVGVIETKSAAATIIGADKSVKNALVELTEIQLAQGIDGKGYFVFTGSLDNVQAGIEFGSNYAKEREAFINSIIIPNPEKEFYMHMA